MITHAVVDWNGIPLESHYLSNFGGVPRTRGHTIFSLVFICVDVSSMWYAGFSIFELEHNIFFEDDFYQIFFVAVKT